MRDSSRTRWFHNHPRLALAAVVAAGVVVVLAAAELGARVLFPQLAPITGERVSYWCYDDTLGWAHRPGQYGRFRHPDFDIDVRINSRGLRDDEYPVARDERRRLLVLGDSFAWGFGVEHRERFSEIIERRHPDWEVINAGVSGYGTDQELLYLRGRGLRYHPDVVLLLFHVNDFENNVRSSEYWYNKPRFRLDHGQLIAGNIPVPPSTFKQRINRFFYGRTWILGRVYAVAAAATRELRRPLWSRAAGTGDGSDITAALLAQMQQTCTEASAVLVVASVPGAAERLGPVLDGTGIPYLPLDAAFTAGRGGGGEPVTFPHDGHWTARGHRIAAGAIEAFLEERGILN
jgi:lysophospholipase L1-like esterase